MSKHRLTPPPPVRPRVGRLAAAAVALVVTGVALLSGIGVINLDSGPARASSLPSTTPSVSGIGSGAAQSDQATPHAPVNTPSTKATPSTSSSAKTSTSNARTVASTLPAVSGEGRRIVFSISDQRVWLVDAKGQPFSTYLVSGSVTHNLKPGKYDVYSKSRWAVGVDDSGVMQYFVRFTRGNNAAIGFHSIPTKLGKPLQTFAQLGTPQSHGCIRQKLSDAIRLWNFAPVGTDVVVLA
jgi:lipoprotein-anchoring transpeptidase ErfK/SrfK